MSANLPIDQVIGVGWGLSPYASACNLLTASKKLQHVLDFGQNVSWKLLEITTADLLDTLLQAQPREPHGATLAGFPGQR